MFVADLISNATFRAQIACSAIESYVGESVAWTVTAIGGVKPLRNAFDYHNSNLTIYGETGSMLKLTRKIITFLSSLVNLNDLSEYICNNHSKGSEPDRFAAPFAQI